MKHFIGILLLLISNLSYAQNKESFLAAWENIQKNSEQVESFENTEKGRYKIKFTTLPFEGELVVLDYDVEDRPFVGTNKSYTKTGYVEVDLVGAPENMMTKYSRSYHKWIATNNLYFNSVTSTWVTVKKFNKDFVARRKDRWSGNLSYILLENWVYILPAIILFLLFSLILNSKRLKGLVKNHNKAMLDMQASIAMQNEGVKLHKETNEILVNILKELKEQR